MFTNAELLCIVYIMVCFYLGRYDLFQTFIQSIVTLLPMWIELHDACSFLQCSKKVLSMFRTAVFFFVHKT